MIDVSKRGTDWKIEAEIRPQFVNQNIVMLGGVNFGVATAFCIL
jgi:hypothetical protein